MNDEATRLETMIKAHRPITIFRAKDLDTDHQKIELLYGDEKLNRYDVKNKQWVEVPNNMHQKPLWGPAGLGNWFNQYTWVMQVFKGDLYIGTMDWSLLEKTMNPEYYAYLESIGKKSNGLGADLWRIPAGTTTGAVAVDLTGQGNIGNCGIRTIASDNNNLYLGSANVLNLSTDPSDNMPNGGWELIKMTPSVPTPTPAPTQPPHHSSGGGAMDLKDLGLLMLLFSLFGIRELYSKRKNT